MRKLVASLLFLVAVQTGCSQDLTWQAVRHMIAADYPNVPSISTDSLAEQLSDDTAPKPILLDARSPQEYAVSHLRGAQRVDPGAGTYPALDTLAANRPIVVYCSVGYRSAGVTQTLREQGFAAVVNLGGSIFRWANEGRPVYRAGRRVEAVHPYDTSWGQLLADSLHVYQPPANAR
ncbi:MAG: rhodanese-like domain-containing protein [Salinibacter sp.]